MENALPTYDVIVLGGGLAGLTLALQLKRRNANLNILVLERKTLPAPEAVHKVGESTVEIGAHYFSNVLGLKEHLQEKQLRKFGFRFFFSEGRRDIDQVTEIGVSQHMTVPSYQLDRGIFENFLAAHAREQGVEFLDGAVVRQLTLTENAMPLQAPHTVGFTQGDITTTVHARWVVDASGRAGTIKRKLGLAEPNNHACHAVWFRVKDRIALDEWSDSPEWHGRCTSDSRWLSTNHLVGAGYWVWLIPLSSGSHSIGIVADPAMHPLERMNTYERAMEWLSEFQPLLFDALDTRRHLLQDFAFFKRFSYGCKQVFSVNRWALTGEAGLFLDPFYSPGSDFIGISNTFVSDLITRDCQGERWGARATAYDQFYQSLYEGTLALYEGQYPILGDPEVLPTKIIWDYAYYWGVLAQFFFHERLTDLSSLAALRSELTHCQELNRSVQGFLRAWSAVSQKRNPAVMLDQYKIPWFAELNRSLTDTLDGPGFIARIQESNSRLTRLAAEILQQAQAEHPELPGFDLTPLRRGNEVTRSAAHLAHGSQEDRLLPEPGAFA